MKFKELSLNGAFSVEVNRLEDERGFFGRLWCAEEFRSHGLNTNLVQSNVSFSSKKGTLRGMHFQNPPFQETKLVRCTRGSVFDVIVDLRPDSPTYCKWEGLELNADKRNMIYVPEGFAHGFITLEDNCEVYYLVTEYYNKEYESGVRYNDPAFNIDWPVDVAEISAKDAIHPDFKK